MRLTTRQTPIDLLARLRRRLAREQGFTMIATLGVLVLASTIATVGFVATQSDIHSTQRDLDAKRAYYAARAGVNEFIHHLNQDTNYWQNCPSVSKTNVPGSNTQEYSYSSVGANGSPCDSTQPIATMIDTSTGTFRMKFTGYSGTPEVTRSLVTSFRRDSPLDFLWYTVYETLDPNAYPLPWDQPYQNCAAFHDARPSYCSEIDFITQDVMNGPMFTQDEFRVCGDPTFGRPNANDPIQAGGNQLWYESCSGSNPRINGNPLANAPTVPLPTVNSRLKVDAGVATPTIFGGETTIDMNGDTANIDATKESSDGGRTWVDSPPTALDLDIYPIIYVDNLSGCVPYYTPFGASYPSFPPSGPCGTVYVHGDYRKPLTIAAADDIVINGNITTQESGGLPSGPAMLGLVANNFVRVMHRCSPDITLGDPTKIDAAILALNHSFMVDNYNCGSRIGTLEVNGAIAQRFRGIVGTHSGGVVSTGYAKDYTYDDRLHAQEPPYMFDIQNASWNIFRETLCVSGSDC